MEAYQRDNTLSYTDFKWLGTDYNNAIGVDNGSNYTYFGYEDPSLTATFGATDNSSSQTNDQIRIQTNGIDYSIKLTASAPTANSVSTTGSNVNFGKH